MSGASSLGAALGVRKGIIPHVDDLGMCHSGNQAFFDLHRRGLVSCGSVMVPCPWFQEVAAAAGRDPSMDLGVHLTLTSEWEHFRWRPISTTSAASGLIDADGFMWRDVAALRRHLVPEAAIQELRAQVERAIAAGLRPTHLDAHMAAAMLPELLPCHVELALEFGLVPVLPRTIRFAPDPDAYADTVRRLESLGHALPDHIRGTQAVDAGETRNSYRQLVATLPNGITHMALHCAVPGDIDTITPLHAPWRTREYALLAAGDFETWCSEAGIAQFGYRQIQRHWFAR